MSYFKAKMQRSPQNPLAGFKGPTSKGRQGINFTRGKGTGGEVRGEDLLLRIGGIGERGESYFLALRGMDAPG